MSDQLDMIDWLRTHEETKPDYLWRARDAARRLLQTLPFITVNDVREVCPVPAGMDPRVLGALFLHQDFEPTGDHVRSSRGKCHHRKIQTFRLTNFYHVHAALGIRKAS